MSLLCCVHDVSPRHFERLRAIDALLAHAGLRGRYAMLVVPDFWGAWDLEDHPEFNAWLRERADEGVELLLHGYLHRDLSEHTGSVDRWRAEHMTAGEGEFLGLSYAEALARIDRGLDKLDAAVGQRPTGFVAPAWLYGEGAHRALAERGFTIAEDQLRVWNPSTGEVLSRDPVVSYASRTVGRTLSSLAWSRIATAILGPLKIVRHAIHPHDLDRPSLQAEIQRSLDVLLEDREPILYGDLLR